MGSISLLVTYVVTVIVARNTRGSNFLNPVQSSEYPHRIRRSGADDCNVPFLPFRVGSVNLEAEVKFVLISCWYNKKALVPWDSI